MSDIVTLVKAKLRRSAKQYWLLGMLTALVAVSLMVSAVLAAGVAHYSRNVRSQSALNLIEVSAVAPEARRQIDNAALAEMKTLPNVAEVQPWQQIDLQLEDSKDWPDADQNPGSLWATPYIRGLVPRLVAGQVPEGGPEEGEIVLPHKVNGGSLERLLGQEVKFTFTEATGPGQGQPGQITLRVVAIADNSVPDKAGQTPTYFNSSQLNQLSQRTRLSSSPTDFVSAFVTVNDAANVRGVQSDLAGRGFAVSSLASQVPSLGGLFDLLDVAQNVVVLAAVAFALMLGSTLGSVWVRSRTREIGLLKALGWSSRRIGVAINLEYLILGGAAAILGSVLGVVGSLGATSAVANAKLDLLPVEAMTPPDWRLLIGAVLIVPICVSLGGMLSGLRAVRVEPDTALRDL